MDGASALAADKKRNKLGYHRTSVACVHCRRRKIRCLLAPGDAQGRCENCIRLKKECNFYPVDQQPPVEKSSRSGPKMESVASGPPSTSSPSLVAGNMGEQAEVFSQYSPAASFSSGRHMSSSFVSNAPAASSIPPFNSDSASPLDFRQTPTLSHQGSWDNTALYQQQQQQQQQPMAPDLPVKPPLGDPPILWSQGGPGMSPIPPTPSGGIPMASEGHMQSMNRNTGLGIRQQGGYVWQPQSGRSMDLQQSNPQLASDFSDQFQQHIPPQNLRSSPYQSVNSSLPDMIPGQIPSSFDPSQPAPASFGYQTWNSAFPDPSNQGVTGTGPDSMGGWYADPLNFPRTREPQ